MKTVRFRGIEYNMKKITKMKIELIMKLINNKNKNKKNYLLKIKKLHQYGFYFDCIFLGKILFVILVILFISSYTYDLNSLRFSYSFRFLISFLSLTYKALSFDQLTSCCIITYKLSIKSLFHIFKIK